MPTTVDGLDEFAQQLEGALHTKLEEVGEWTHDQLEGVLIQSQKLVPVRYGDLKDSGFVTEVIYVADNFSVGIGYSAPYAMVQHERLDYVHRIGQAKYLEEPLTEWASNVLGL